MLNTAQLVKQYKAVLNRLPSRSPNMQRVIAASNQVSLRPERRQSSSCASAAMPAIVSSVGQSASAEDSGVSASGHVGGASSSAEQSASSGQAAASDSNIASESEELKSIQEVAQWLETLPDLTVDAELVKMHEAVLVSKERSPEKKGYGACVDHGSRQ